MIRAAFISLTLLLFLVCSCNKDNVINPAITSYPNFSQLKVGNFWIYQRFSVDSSGNATPMNVFDSCYIEKDTIINNRTYFKMIKPDYFPTDSVVRFLYDSLHYIVDSSGQILFSSQDFQTILSSFFFISSPDTIAEVIRKMTDRNLIVSCPLGSFSTLNCKETRNMYPNWRFAGNPRYRNTRYSENIGIVIETLPFFITDPNYVERRLVRFHLN